MNNAVLVNFVHLVNYTHGHVGKAQTQIWILKI